MSPRIHFASLVLALLTLAACGGGGGGGTASNDAAPTSEQQASEPDPAPAPASQDSSTPETAKSMVDALAGDWETCFVPSGTPVASYFEKTHVTRISDTQFAIANTVTKTYSPDCTGDVFSTYEGSGVITLTGSASAWDPVTRRTVHAERYAGVDEENEPITSLFHITDDDTLQFGDNEDRGPDGYPRSLQPGLMYVRK